MIGIAWQMLPMELGCGSGSTCWRRLRDWQAAGGTATEDVTEPGTEVRLNPGDAIHYEDDVVHTARNAGD